MNLRNALSLLALSCLAPVVLLLAQAPNASRTQVNEGERIYKAGCIACHGPDGRGTPQTQAGFQRPDTFPDFTRCDQTSMEPNVNWKDVIVHGGPTRGFSQIMPSFGEALTSDQIDEVVLYLRGLCRNPHWARGELNVPRAIVTEKAFPEDEEVVSTAVNARGAPGVTTDIIHEQRFGVKNQIEVDVPLTFQDLNHTWYGGTGDTTLGVKRAFWSILGPRAGSIFAGQGSVIVPTGNRSRGFGAGTTTFEAFAAFDQIFQGGRHMTGNETFFQFQFGADLPLHTAIAPNSLFWRAAVGQSLGANRGYGRLWSPMLELLADRDLETGAKTNWDLLPQIQVTISRRQHIKADLGVRVPATNTQGRPVQLMLYLLWDWADGKLTEGW